MASSLEIEKPGNAGWGRTTRRGSSQPKAHRRPVRARSFLCDDNGRPGAAGNATLVYRLRALPDAPVAAGGGRHSVFSKRPFRPVDQPPAEFVLTQVFALY